MKAGDTVHSATTELSFTVVSHTKKGLVVDVQRRVLNKTTGEITIDVRRREIAPWLIPLFTKGYIP